MLAVYVRDGYLGTSDYVPLVIHLNLLAEIGIFLRNSKFDQLFAVWYLLTAIAFEFIARSAG